MKESVFTAWETKDAQLWGNRPIRLGHRLQNASLFSDETLAEVIESYPRQRYSIVHVAERGSGKRIWREGDIGGLTGREVIEAIAAGSMWLNLRNIHLVDKRFADLVDEIFDEIAARTGMPPVLARNAGVLISSPRAQVLYHADLPGQSLWQIRGRKTVYVYPPVRPFLTPQQLEKIILTGIEVDMSYEPWYDEHAMAFDIGPGDMLHWPLNSPHRVDNHDCLNISLTTEYWTEAIRRHAMVNCANAVLRHKAGLNPASRSTTGAGFWAKAAFQACVKRAGLLGNRGAESRPIEFRLDRSRPGSIIDIAAEAQ